MVDLEGVVAFPWRECVGVEKFRDRKPRHPVAWAVIVLQHGDRRSMLVRVKLSEHAEVDAAHADGGEGPEKS